VNWWELPSGKVTELKSHLFTGTVTMLPLVRV